MNPNLEQVITPEQIKKEVDSISLKFWNDVMEKSKQMFPDNAINAWVFRGRIYQALFASHFISVNYPAIEALEKAENES